MSLTGKVAIVTGGGSGIGRAISLQLARDGAAVSVWDLNGDSAEQTVQLIVAAGGRAIACVGDASSQSDIKRSAQLTREEFGTISILVNNAGITRDNLALRMKDEDWDAVEQQHLRDLAMRALLKQVAAAVCLIFAVCPGTAPWISAA